MKNKSVNILLVLVFTLICITMANFEVNAAVNKPARVKFLTLNRENKTCVNLKWEKIGKAKGYEIYMKTNNGKFKKIKAIKKTGLKVGNSYTFKIRAYTKAKGKKCYGKYSSAKKINMKDYVYLVDMMKPYSSEKYTQYNSVETLEMGGNKYSHGFELFVPYFWGSGDSAYAIYNLNSQYSKIEFTVGSLEATNELVISCDDEEIQRITINESSLPKTYTIDVRDTYKFELNCFNKGT